MRTQLVDAIFEMGFYDLLHKRIVWLSAGKIKTGATVTKNVEKYLCHAPTGNPSLDTILCSAWHRGLIAAFWHNDAGKLVVMNLNPFIDDGVFFPEGSELHRELRRLGVEPHIASNRAPMPLINIPVVNLGTVYMTDGVKALLDGEEIERFLQRHRFGDWGELDRDDWNINQTALLQKGRLLSRYRSVGGKKVYVITEPEWMITTVLLAEEY